MVTYQVFGAGDGISLGSIDVVFLASGLCCFFVCVCLFACWLDMLGGRPAEFCQVKKVYKWNRAVRLEASAACAACAQGSCRSMPCG